MRLVGVLGTPHSLPAPRVWTARRARPDSRNLVLTWYIFAHTLGPWPRHAAGGAGSTVWGPCLALVVQILMGLAQAAIGSIPRISLSQIHEVAARFCR